MVTKKDLCQKTRIQMSPSEKWWRGVSEVMSKMSSMMPSRRSSGLLLHRTTSKNGNTGFEDLKNFIKDGGDFAKEVATILEERAELEAVYSKARFWIYIYHVLCQREHFANMEISWWVTNCHWQCAMAMAMNNSENRKLEIGLVLIFNFPGCLQAGCQAVQGVQGEHRNDLQRLALCCQWLWTDSRGLPTLHIFTFTHFEDMVNLFEPFSKKTCLRFTRQ